MNLEEVGCLICVALLVLCIIALSLSLIYCNAGSDGVTCPYLYWSWMSKG